jgi:hypothetical protein
MSTSPTWDTPLTWDGSHLGSFNRSQVTELGTVKIGRNLKILRLEQKEVLAKTSESRLPVIFDELKPIFSLQKIGTHSFRYLGKLWIAYRPFILNKAIYPELTLDLANEHTRKKISRQVRFNLAFREIFGIADTHERSFILRYKNPYSSEEVPTVISFLEPSSISLTQDSTSTILSQCLLDRWFNLDDPTQTMEATVAQLICLNRECVEASIGYYRPLVEEVIVRLEKDFIGYADLFFDRLLAYFPS